VTECARLHQPATVHRHACSLEIFRRWLRARLGAARILDLSLLSKALLAEFYAYLIGSGLHGRLRRPASAQKILATVERWWAWAYNEDVYAGLVPQPRRLPVAQEPRTPTAAPTWEEMDRCIVQCRGWQRQLAILLRFTGLRVQQAMQLRWDDFDLQVCRLRIRGELGKTPDERKGRIIPVSRHLAAEMATWGPHDGLVIKSSRKQDGPRAHEARGRDMARAWKRAGVRPEVWKQRPHHAFRKGLVSGLKRLGADDEAVEFLVGHTLGIRGIYTDPEALPLQATVDVIPAPAGDQRSSLVLLPCGR